MRCSATRLWPANPFRSVHLGDDDGCENKQDPRLKESDPGLEIPKYDPYHLACNPLPRVELNHPKEPCHDLRDRKQDYSRRRDSACPLSPPWLPSLKGGRLHDVLIAERVVIVLLRLLPLDDGSRGLRWRCAGWLAERRGSRGCSRRVDGQRCQVGGLGIRRLLALLRDHCQGSVSVDGPEM